MRYRETVLLLFGALLLCISFGFSLKTASADMDIQSLFTNWFNNKKTAAIYEIDLAITEEKESLMKQLKAELQMEIQLAADSLAEFTAKEKSKRIANLREHAKALIVNMQIDHDAEQAAISAKLDEIVERAIAEMNGSAIPTEPKIIPTPETSPDPPITPDTDDPEGVPDSESTPVTNPDPTPVAP